MISVPEQVAEKLEPSDDSSGPSYVDYSERRSLPISIPDCNFVEQFGDKHVVNWNTITIVSHYTRFNCFYFIKQFRDKTTFQNILMI